MKLSKRMQINFAALALGAVFLLCSVGEISAQRRVVRTAGRTSSDIAKPAVRRSRAAPLPSIAPLPENVNPFQSLKAAASMTGVVDITFTPTNLDPRARATGQVAMLNGTLLVRVKAEDMPVPTSFGVPRYAMWVYVPNHGVRIYIGDLPITPTSRIRGKSDSAYRYTALPSNAVFGGLMLTAEPVRYEPIVNEPLRPLLVSLAEGVNPKYASTALTVYSYPLKPVPRRKGVRRAGARQPTRGQVKRRATPQPRRTRRN